MQSNAFGGNASALLGSLALSVDDFGQPRSQRAESVELSVVAEVTDGE